MVKMLRDNQRVVDVPVHWRRWQEGVSHMAATALVTTTIYVPQVLMDYAHDAKTYGREIKIYVAGDQKNTGDGSGIMLSYCPRDRYCL